MLVLDCSDYLKSAFDVPFIDPDKPSQYSEIDEHAIYKPPDTLQLPPDMVQSDSNQFADSDSSSSQDNPTSPDVSIECERTHCVYCGAFRIYTHAKINTMYVAGRITQHCMV